MNENRPEYQKLLSKLSEGIFDAVLSVNLARVTRDDAETPKFMSLLRQEDVVYSFTVRYEENIFLSEKAHKFWCLSIVPCNAS